MYEFYCPCCDRLFTGDTAKLVEEKVKDHVANQHPDYDPEWFDTYPTYSNE